MAVFACGQPEVGESNAIPPKTTKNLEATREQSLEHWSWPGDAALAEEATQEAFIRGYRRLCPLGDGAKFADWTTSIARQTDISVTLLRLMCYAGIRQVLPGFQSRRCPDAHQRGQPLKSGALNAKNAPESTICGVHQKRSHTTCSMLLLVPISFPRTAPCRASRTNLPSDALWSRRFPPSHFCFLLFRRVLWPLPSAPCRAGATRRRVSFQHVSVSGFQNSPPHFPLSPPPVSAHHCPTLRHGRHNCTVISRLPGVPLGPPPSR